MPFRNKTFSICLKNNFVKPHNISTHSAHSDNFYFHFFYPLSDWVEILWGFTKFFFKQMLKISIFYLEKQKVLFLKKYDLSRSLQIGQDSSNRWRFAVPIFSDGFGRSHRKTDEWMGSQCFQSKKGSLKIHSYSKHFSLKLVNRQLSHQ